MIRNLMKVLSNLFGNNTKINANSIAVKKVDNSADTLDNCVIVDSGSNSNGSWIKWADGTMICTKKMYITTAINLTWGSVYESDLFSLGNYAQKFTSIPDIYAQSVGTACFIEAIVSPTTTSFGTTYIWRPASTASREYCLSLFAIGKWK